MPYDPTKPANNSPIVSAELRNQFAGLKDQIDAVQAQANALPTTSDVNAAITANSAGSIVGVAVLELTLSNPPTAMEVQTIVGKINELIGVLSRA